MKVIKKLISLFTKKGSQTKKADSKKKVAANTKRHSKQDNKDFKSKQGANRQERRRSDAPRAHKKSDAKPAHKPHIHAKPVTKTVLEPEKIADLKTALPDFADLKLGAEVLSAIKSLSYATPTEIQKLAIPVILEGKDIVGTAQTGTGKTAAFALPIIEMLEKSAQTLPRVLVLSPTRELAAQIADAFEKFSAYTPIRTLLIQGGVSMGNQVRILEQGVDILVATPGRLLDLIRQKILNLKSIKYLCLDEVDRMFDMGFIEDVSNIIRYCPKNRQTLFFSATMPDAVMRLSKWALTDPETIGAGTAHSPADTIEHFLYPVDRIQKHDMLLALLNSLNFESTIIFTRTRMDADRISRWIEDNQHTCAVLHSDKSQSEREQALKSFKSGKVKILVATDIASRGLDISNITYVINYNVPEHPEDYVHRIGRTGRANKEGKAITLYASEERSFLQRIEKFIGAAIEQKALDGFNYRNEPVLEVKAKVVRRRNR